MLLNVAQNLAQNETYFLHDFFFNRFRLLSFNFTHIRLVVVRVSAIAFATAVICCFLHSYVRLNYIDSSYCIK